jgi:hypothetical protein
MTERKPTMVERLKAHGIKVREPSGQGVVIPGAPAVIDIALEDTKLGRHWLHPSLRFKGDPRWEAIRAKHRARHREKKR